jgi:hypothetical protein
MSEDCDTLCLGMANELDLIAGQVSALAGEVLHPDGLTARAADRRASAPA